MKKLSKGWSALTMAACLLAAPAPAAIQPGAAADDDIEEIVVTARRTGIPVWRVEGPRTTLVLIGSVHPVAPDTRWNPGALTETLRQADRVLFANVLAMSGSPFAAIGYLWRWRKQATLPKGQTLATLLPPEQFRRLVALEEKGVLKDGFERKHPLHLAMQLRSHAQGKMKESGGANGYVNRAVKTYKLKTVPIRRIKAKSMVKDFFATPPQAFIPCLLDAAALVEAGPGAMKAHSDAWAERRVADALASPASKDFTTCAPTHLREVLRPDLRPRIRQLMSEPQMTVAVVDLRSLGQPGGILDDLSAAGFDVRGPAWKRIQTSADHGGGVRTRE